MMVDWLFLMRDVVKVILTCGEDGVGLLRGLLRLACSTADLDAWDGVSPWDS
jgi:hypothetical protein